MHSIEEPKKRLKLRREQREVIVGILLGDAHLETQNRGRTYRLKIEHPIRQREYVMHLYEIFRDWVLTPPRICIRKRETPAGTRQYTMIDFATVSHGSFRFYAHQFYRDAKKAVPKLIHRWLTPRALAYWFMDDGSIKWRHSRAIIMNTQGFERRDVERLAQVLREKYALETYLRKTKDGYQLCISGRSLERFVELIAPYLHESMCYKLPRQANISAQTVTEASKGPLRRDGNPPRSAKA